MRDVQKRYQREFFMAMVSYVATLFISVSLLKAYGANLGLLPRSLLALTPMLPIGLVARTLVRAIRDSDELERRIDLEAAAIAGLLIGLVYFSLGLLAAGKAIVLDGSAVAIWVFPALCGTFGAAKCWTARRYRG